MAGTNLRRARCRPAAGWVQLWGLDPLLRDILRTTHLDRAFDVCRDEAEALGLIIR
jgi:hypothetical protein